MKNINNGLMKFINTTPNAFSCVENIKKILDKNGFIEHDETSEYKWVSDLSDKFYIVRGDSSIIAFDKGSDVNSFNIVSTHTDQPSFTIKPNSEITENGYVKLNISGYGAMISESWLDRPLSIAGRVILRKNDTFSSQIIDIDRDLLIIPRQAIHINHEAEQGKKLNPQIDMLPVIGLETSNGKAIKIEDIIKEELKKKDISYDSICDYDMSLYNRDKAKIIGANKEMISAPRLDDLACVYTSLMAFVDAGSNSNDVTNVFCAFNNEEIGSLSMQGANSPFLSDNLNRILNSNRYSLRACLNNSFIVSADNAHAIHPNAANKSDPTNKVKLNNGVVIKHHTNYTTDALTSSVFKSLCDNADALYQDFACKSGMHCGSTLGKISQSQVPIRSVDIGIPQLAMHSANELIGTKDTEYMYKALMEFYQASFMKDIYSDSLKVKMKK